VILLDIRNKIAIRVTSISLLLRINGFHSLQEDFVMKKKFDFVSVFVIGVMLVTLMLVTSVVPNQSASASAQNGNQLPPDTIVSSDGVTVQAPEFSKTSKMEAPFAGTEFMGDPTLQVAPDAKQLAPLTSGYAESVIGADGRTRITGTTAYPNRAIVFLEVNFPSGSGTCSGWYYGARIVATAGHCVYNATYGGWATSIKVYPGRNGTSTPYGYTTAHRMFSVTGWTGSANPDYDYGAIQTNSAKGNTVGWFGYFWQSSNSFPGTFNVRGYPGDKTYGTLWTMSGLNKATTTRRLWYSIDTFGGQSGSPYYTKPGGVCCYGAGIHTYGVPLSPYTSYNSATRITQSVFNNMKTWKGYAYP
jgi:glutamyl endopeptidase